MIALSHSVYLKLLTLSFVCIISMIHLLRLSNFIIVHFLLLSSRVRNWQELNTKLKGAILGDVDELDDTGQEGEEARTGADKKNIGV